MSGPLLIIGQTGQLARAASRLDSDAISLSREQLDLTWNEKRLTTALDAIFEDVQPRAVLNAAAYTQVDRAETERDLAFRINAEAVATIAKLCESSDIPLVHVSTDYVFSGRNNQPWHESDLTDPINIYGQSKRAGEVAIEATTTTAAILRTSWVYDLNGRNFVTTMLGLARERDTVSVVNDQVGRPTHADVLARAALNLIGYSGIFHVSGAGAPTSWAGFAQEIFKAAKLATQINRIRSIEYPTPADRPRYSVLDLSKYEKDVGPLPDWQDSLARAFSQKG